MSQTRTLEEAALVPVRAAASRRASEMRNAMSPVPPATSRKRRGSSGANAKWVRLLRRAPVPRPRLGGERRTIRRRAQFGDEVVLPQPVQRPAHEVVHRIVSTNRRQGVRRRARPPCSAARTCSPPGETLPPRAEPCPPLPPPGSRSASCGTQRRVQRAPRARPPSGPWSTSSKTEPSCPCAEACARACPEWAPPAAA